jgi:hypothetical protein
VRCKLAEAWTLDDAEAAERRLRELARALEAKRPGAAASLRGGLEETLTITRVGLSIEGALARTLRSTNPIESMLSVSRERSRNVKRWRRGIVLRWSAAGMLDAERNRRVPLRFEHRHHDLARSRLHLAAERPDVRVAGSVAKTASSTRGDAPPRRWSTRRGSAAVASRRLQLTGQDAIDLKPRRPRDCFGRDVQA